MRAPEITAPVGQIPYYSLVTHRQEPLPTAVSVIGAPGKSSHLLCSQLPTNIWAYRHGSHPYRRRGTRHERRKIADEGENWPVNVLIAHGNYASL